MLSLFGCIVISSNCGAQDRGRTNTSAQLEALVKAAKAEGELTFYISQTENVGRRTSDAFTRKFGVRASFVRLASKQLQQRYAAEAESGNVPADLLSTGSAQGFSEDGFKRGWFDALSTAGIQSLTAVSSQRD